MILGEFALGAACLLRGFALLPRRGLRRYVLIPLMLNALLFGLALAWAGAGLEKWQRRLIALLPHWLDWLVPLLWVAFAAVALLALFYGFALLANAVGAPFNAFLSARAEELLTGRRPDSGRGLWTEIAVSLSDEFRRLIYILWWTLLVGLLGLLLVFVPLLGAAVPLLWFLFTAWMLALQYSDYPLSNRGVAFAAQRGLLRQKRARLLGFGMAAAVCTLLPIINLLAMPAAVIGATLLWLPSSGE